MAPLLAREQIAQRSVLCYTTNPGKKEEISRFFSLSTDQSKRWSVSFPEIEGVREDELLSGHEVVAAYKAYMAQQDSKIELLVEDTSLGIEGFDENGVCIKWLQQIIKEKMELFQGRKATFRVSLAQRQVKWVWVYAGEVTGTIIAPRGTSGFGFDDFFIPDDQPNGTKFTMAEIKDRQTERLDPVGTWDRFNPRYLAVEKYKRQEASGSSCEALEEITGLPHIWQEKDEAQWILGYQERLSGLRPPSRGKLRL